MAASKVGLVHPKSQGHEDDGDINWCKYVCGFPNPKTYSPEYRAFRNAMKRKMEQDRIPGWKRSTAAQWAAIQAYALTISPVSRRAAHWQAVTVRGERFTECLDFLLKDIAKKHARTLTDLLVAQPVAAGAAPVAAGAAPVAVGNDRKLPQTVSIEYVQYMLIWVLQEPPVRALSVCG